MDAIGSTRSNLEKLELASVLLQKADSDEELHAIALMLLGRVFPAYDEAKKLNVGSRLLWQVVLELSQHSEQETREQYRKDSDTGRLVEFALAKKKTTLFSFIQETPEKTTYEVLDVFTFFHKIATVTGAGSQKKRAQMVKEILNDVSPCEAKYIARIILEETRVGFREGNLEAAVAKAFNIPLDLVRRANMLLSNIGEVAIAARKGKAAIEQVQFHPFRPIRVMLAEKADTVESALEYHQGELSVEFKLDGARTQAHRVGSQVKLYSRRLNDISEAFPNICQALQNLESDVVLDGELLGILEGKSVFFQDFSRRIRRKHDVTEFSKTVPTTYFAFDLLWLNGDSLLDHPYLERRALLQKVITPSEFLDLVPSYPITSAQEGQHLLDQALAQGLEGLMLKAPRSKYLAGRRGKNWYKLKRVFAELDLVIIAAEYGHGKRTGLLSDYYLAARDEDEFLVVGKTFKGLTDLEIQQMTERLHELTIEDEGWRVQVQPEIVVQVAFDNIQASKRYKSGYALRFARIVHIRRDKSPNEADTLETVRELFESQMKRQRRAKFQE